MKISISYILSLLVCLVIVNALPTGYGSDHGSSNVANKREFKIEYALTDFRTNIVLKREDELIVEDLIAQLEEYAKLRQIAGWSDEELRKRDFSLITQLLAFLNGAGISPGIIHLFATNPLLQPLVISTIVTLIKTGAINFTLLFNALEKSGVVPQVIQSLISDCDLYSQIFDLASGKISDLLAQVIALIKAGVKLFQKKELPMPQGSQMAIYSEFDTVVKRDIITDAVARLFQSLVNSGLADSVIKAILTDSSYLPFATKLVTALVDSKALNMPKVLQALKSSGLVDSIINTILNAQSFNAIFTNALAAYAGRCGKMSGFSWYLPVPSTSSLPTSSKISSSMKPLSIALSLKASGLSSAISSLKAKLPSSAQVSSIPLSVKVTSVPSLQPSNSGAGSISLKPSSTGVSSISSKASSAGVNSISSQPTSVGVSGSVLPSASSVKVSLQSALSGAASSHVSAVKSGSLLVSSNLASSVALALSSGSGSQVSTPALPSAKASSLSVISGSQSAVGASSSVNPSSFGSVSGKLSGVVSASASNPLSSNSGTQVLASSVIPALSASASSSAPSRSNSASASALLSSGPLSTFSLVLLGSSASSGSSVPPSIVPSSSTAAVSAPKSSTPLATVVIPPVSTPTASSVLSKVVLSAAVLPASALSASPASKGINSDTATATSPSSSTRPVVPSTAVSPSATIAPSSTPAVPPSSTVSVASALALTIKTCKRRRKREAKSFNV